MKKAFGRFILAIFILQIIFVGTRAAFAQSGLTIAFGSKGLQTLVYGGVVLEDVGHFPGDTFHIWHMKCTDLNGNVVSSGQYGWGESNYGESWDPAQNTETYTFVWGTVATRFVQSGNNLDMIVTETNNAGSGVIFDGAEIYPMALHFPEDPVGFSGYSQFAITTTGPGVTAADYGSGVVTSVIPNEALSLYGGWKAAGPNTYTPIMTSTAPDDLATFLPRNDRPVQPGTSFTYTVSLRFTPEGTSASTADAYASFAATYPSQMTWTDKRIVGTAYLASSPQGTADITHSGGYPTNPRRYFNDPGVDITSAAGLRAFQDRMLAQAAANVINTQAMSGQGVITWDIEGEQYPQTTTYVCSPEQIASVAPEMELAITDPNSQYYGQKLDDAYFRIMTSAGLKVGLCLRPQMFALAADGTASQTYLTGNLAIVSNLETKARYANARWGATIFYVDSTVDINGGTLDPAIFQQLITDFPSFLFIPEESTPRYYAYSAPFYSFLNHGSLGTPASTYLYYPHAFGANLVNDVSAGALATYTPQLTQSVMGGDILMGHADYWDANDPTLVSIYQAAGATSPVTQTTPVLTWLAPASVPFGTALSPIQLNATSSVPGSFVYAPAAGTVLGAGACTLLVTFTPTDAANYTSTTTSVPFLVTPGLPVINWAIPSAIAQGTALSAVQLNANANVSGSFVYSPAAGAVLSSGPAVLRVMFTPTDTADYLSQTKSVTLIVNGLAPPASNLAILFPFSGGVVSGTLQVSGYVNLTLDSAGTFLMVDGVEIGTRRVTSGPYFYPLDTTTLLNGSHTLQLWGHDIGNNTSLSDPILVTVAN